MRNIPAAFFGLVCTASAIQSLYPMLAGFASKAGSINSVFRRRRWIPLGSAATARLSV
jgi:hypothetical protein